MLERRASALFHTDLSAISAVMYYCCSTAANADSVGSLYQPAATLQTFTLLKNAAWPMAEYAARGSYYGQEEMAEVMRQGMIDG